MVAFAGLVVHFETQFAAVAAQMVEEDRLKPQPATVTGEVAGGWNLVSAGSAGTLSVNWNSRLTSCYLTFPAIDF